MSLPIFKTLVSICVTCSKITTLTKLNLNDFVLEKDSDGEGVPMEGIPVKEIIG